jgi:hypothetical protein
MTECYECGKEGADFDCNGLKFCDGQCGLSFLEPEIETVRVRMIKTLSDKIPNGTEGWCQTPKDGLNQVNFDNGFMAFVYQHEIQVIKIIFEVGKPIPKVWLHMEFDFDDTQKYLNDALIENEEELKRIVDKYAFGCNEYCGIARSEYVGN